MKSASKSLNGVRTISEENGPIKIFSFKFLDFIRFKDILNNKSKFI
jgi:hypothetical protein